MDRPKVEISILAAALNEEEIIDDFINSILAIMKDFSGGWELIIVENGSKDRTAEIIEKYSKKNKQVILKRLPNPSYGKAMIEAMKNAKGKYSVFFNIDFWDKKFVDICKVDLLGYDFICSSKLHINSTDNRPWFRKMTTYLYSLFLRMALGLNGTDTHGVKAFKTKMVFPILKKCQTRSGIFDSELVIRSQRAGLKFLELPTEVKEIRPSRFPLSRVFKTPFDMWMLIRVIQVR